MVHFMNPNGQQFMSYDYKKFGQTGPFGMNWPLGEISPSQP
jgi:hypothetical protein